MESAHRALRALSDYELTSVLMRMWLHCTTWQGLSRDAVLDEYRRRNDLRDSIVRAQTRHDQRNIPDEPHVRPSPVQPDSNQEEETMAKRISTEVYVLIDADEQPRLNCMTAGMHVYRTEAAAKKAGGQGSIVKKFKLMPVKEVSNGDDNPVPETGTRPF